MKVKPIYWVALGLALVLTVAVCDGLRLRDKASVAAGKYEEALTQERVNGKALTLQIGEMQKVVGQRDKEIAEKNKTIGCLTNAIGHRDADLVTLGGRLAQAKTDTDRVPILTAMVENWRAQYNTATLIITEKDKVISAWAAKFDAQVTISESWKAKYDAECRLLQLATQGWKASERKLRWARVMSNVKSGLILATVGYVGYSAIKGK
jgi:tetraacyldisaccharide-1-P 4'-kinase